MKKKKVFITGIDSFVGKNLIKNLADKFDFYGIDKVKGKFYQAMEADLCSKDLIKLLKKDTEVIINLAALSDSKACNDDPINCYQTNVVGLVNLLEIAKRKKIKNIIHASTEWVYEDNNKLHKEDESINFSKITSHYALSKIIDEQILRIYHAQNPYMNISCLRFGIIYGERKKNFSAFESIIRNVMSLKELSVGSLKTGRHFIHINDIVKAIVTSFNNKGFNIFNIQGSDFVTLDMLIKESTIQLNKKVKVVESNRNRPSIRKMSNIKAKTKLKFEAKLSYKQGISEIINFFKNDK